MVLDKYLYPPVFKINYGSYSINDQFDGINADMSSGDPARDSSPGPGKTLVNANSVFSISGNDLYISPSGSAGNKLYFNDTITRTNGLALGIYYHTNTTNLRGYLRWLDTNAEANIQLGGSAVNTRSTQLASSFNAGTFSNRNVVIAIAMNSGYLLYGKFFDHTYPVWSFIGRINTGTANLKPAIEKLDAAWSTNVKWIRAAQLPLTTVAQFARLYSATVSDGMTFTHQPTVNQLSTSMGGSFLVEMKFDVLPSTETKIIFAKKDNDNYLYYTISPAGSMTYFERIAGVDTQKATSANRIQAGERFAFKAFVSAQLGYEVTTAQAVTARISYSGATPTDFLSTTDGSISLGGATVSDFIVWDCKPDGEVVSVLNTYFGE